MCGICGIYSFDNQPVAREILARMTSMLAHRGPDANGIFQAAHIGLGHRRLSIIDLAHGDQPLYNENKSICLVANGEIYNFKALREELIARGHTFATHSDSEVIVHCYEEYQDKCCEHLRGMFAFALWDAPRQRLLLARDRLGEKPLVYWHGHNHFAFASELQSLLAYPGIPREVNETALNLYLSFLCVPSPHTMFKNVYKLPPAHYLVVERNQVTVQRYWHITPRIDRRKTLNTYVHELRALAEESVRLRQVSDVPVGVFLSGGLDSTSVLSLMHAQVGDGIPTFSVGFAHKLYNELPFARQAAEFFHTDHHELVVEPQVVELLPRIVRHYGEPFADFSCIPTFYLARFAAQSVKVVLTGDGADEAFAGYDRYLACKFGRVLDTMPVWLRRLMYHAVARLPHSDDMRLRNWQIKRFFRSAHYPAQQRYLEWIAAFPQGEKSMLVRDAVSARMDPDEARNLLQARYAQTGTDDFLAATLLVDSGLYLPDDLQAKMDIATMSSSLEARAPFLDHVLFEYAMNIPTALKLRGNEKKYILKTMMRARVPQAIVRRKKQGFGLPIGAWFRGDLAPLVHDILLADNARASGYFNQSYLARLYAEHCAGTTDNGYKLWTALMFEMWYHEFVKNRTA